MVLEIWVQSQVASYQRLLKWYLIPPCLTLSNIRSVLRVKWSNSGKGVAPSRYLGVVAIEKGAFWSPSTKVVNFTYIYIYIYIYIYREREREEILKPQKTCFYYSEIIKLYIQIRNWIYKKVTLIPLKYILLPSFELEMFDTWSKIVKQGMKKRWICIHIRM